MSRLGNASTFSYVDVDAITVFWRRVSGITYDAAGRSTTVTRTGPAVQTGSPLKTLSPGSDAVAGVRRCRRGQIRDAVAGVRFGDAVAGVRFETLSPGSCRRGQIRDSGFKGHRRSFAATFLATPWFDSARRFCANHDRPSDCEPRDEAAGVVAVL